MEDAVPHAGTRGMGAACGERWRRFKEETAVCGGRANREPAAVAFEGEGWSWNLRSEVHDVVVLMLILPGGDRPGNRFGDMETGVEIRRA